jgi:outer membrane protein assembly factor BamE (lipoprotein component of BamABCDE complex)
MKSKINATQKINVCAMRFLLFALLSFIPVLLQSCASSQQTTGRPIDQPTVTKIIDGQTTADEILAWFGAPTSTSSLGENQLYIYKYCVSKGSGFYTGYFGQTKSEEKCDELTVTFNKDGKVKAHNFIKRLESSN